MFNPLKAAQFLARMLAVLLPILGVAIVLGMVDESFHREVGLLALATSWRFWLALLRDISPSVVALLAAYLLAARFVQHLYKVESFAEARAFVDHRLFGLTGFRPWMRVAGGSVEGSSEHILRRVGGPGNVVVYNDSAVLLERAGQLTRVEGAGYVRLDSFEKVYQAVDLRPKRSLESVEAMSKEGIPITCEVDISYQIDGEGALPTEELPFPMSKEKVFQAATCAWIREAYLPEGDRTLDWSGQLVVGVAGGTLRTILAQYPLDRLIGLTTQAGENAREEIRQRLETELAAAAPDLGARVLAVELGDIQVQDEVTQQWIEAWKAEWQAWAAEREGMGKADQAERWENAKTQAQAAVLATIGAAFQSLRDQEQEVTSRLVLARLFMVLSRAPSDPLTRVNLPNEAIRSLKLIEDLIS